MGSFKCVFRGWGYFYKLLVVTLAPFGLISLATGLYLVAQRRIGRLRTRDDRRRVLSNVTYGTLLFIYVVLPSISSTVIPFYACEKFKRGKDLQGEQRDDLHVLAVDLSIKCDNSRYRRWSPFVAMMIAVWPVGVPVGLAVLLWSNRAKLNPALPRFDLAPSERRTLECDGPEREQLRHAMAMEDHAKLKLRNEDESIAALEFIFEDYWPRYYLFPIFELVRRLFLTSVLALFHDGKTQQLVVGLLGSMLSYAVYAYCEAYVEHDDNVVAPVAQAELVLLYFAALAAFTSELWTKVEDKGDRAFSDEGFGVVLVLISLSSFAVAVYVILVDIFGHAELRAAQHRLRTLSIEETFPRTPVTRTTNLFVESKSTVNDDATLL